MLTWKTWSVLTCSKTMKEVDKEGRSEKGGYIMILSTVSHWSKLTSLDITQQPVVCDVQ